MPSLKGLVGKLVKSDRRKEWKALKTKHAAALKTKGVKFQAGFGTALDNYAKPLATVSALFAAEKLSRPALQKVIAAAHPLEAIAVNYLSNLKGLGGPAEKELSAFLKAVAADCQGWDQVEDMFEQTNMPVRRPAFTAVKALYGPLDKLAAQLENLGKSLPAARAEVAAGRTTAKRPKAKPVKLSAAEWAHVQTISEAAWGQLLGTKLDAMLGGWDRLAPVRATTQQEVTPLLTAVNLFDAQANYDSLKERADTVAAGSLAAFEQACQALLALQTDPEVKTELGFEAGLPFIQNTRAINAVKAAGDYAAELRQAIGRLP